MSWKVLSNMVGLRAVALGVMNNVVTFLNKTFFTGKNGRKLHISYVTPLDGLLGRSLKNQDGMK